MAKTMTMADALKKAGEVMVLAAKAAKDRGVVSWTADEHVRASGYIIRVLFHPKDPEAERLEPTAANFAAVFHATYNQSAWRQKFEKDGLFEKKAAKTYDAAMEELEEEMGE